MKTLALALALVATAAHAYLSPGCVDGYSGTLVADLPGPVYVGTYGIVDGPPTFDEHFAYFVFNGQQMKIQLRAWHGMGMDPRPCWFSGEYEGDPIFLGDME
jgi:hypothetical protein